MSVLEQRARQAYREEKAAREARRRALEEEAYQKGLQYIAERLGEEPEQLEEELNWLFGEGGWAHDRASWRIERMGTGYFLVVKGKCPECGKAVWSVPIKPDLADIGRFLEEGFRVDISEHWDCPGSRVAEDRDSHIVSLLTELVELLKEG